MSRRHHLPLRRLKANMWTALAAGAPTTLIALTWIRWRRTISRAAGDQSGAAWNMPPATFALGSMLFKVEHFHLCLWLFYRQSWSPHGASSAKWFIPPPAATSTPWSSGGGGGGVRGWDLLKVVSKPGDAVNKGGIDIVFVFKLKSCAHRSQREPLPPPPPRSVVLVDSSSLSVALHPVDGVDALKRELKTKQLKDV